MKDVLLKVDKTPSINQLSKLDQELVFKIARFLHTLKLEFNDLRPGVPEIVILNFLIDNVFIPKINETTQDKSPPIV